MENDAHVKKLHTSLLRSRWAIFAIVGFLTLLTYLLITVSKQVGTTETQINTAPRASTNEPNAPLPPMSCSSYGYYAIFSIMHLKQLKIDLGCNALTPTPWAYQQDAPSGGTSVCEKLDIDIKNLEELERFVREMCDRCPMPTPSPAGPGGGPFPTPTGTYPTRTPIYPSGTPGPRYYPSPTLRPQPTSSGPIIPIDPQPTYATE